jgi:hypothetical protein
MDKHLEELERDVERLGKKYAKEEDEELGALIKIELEKARGERDNFIQMRADAYERDARRHRMVDHQEQIFAFMQAAWDRLHEEGDDYEPRRGLLLAFDVRVLVYKRDHTPRWVLVWGMDDIIDGALTGDLTSRLLYDGDAACEAQVVAELEPTVRQEMRFRVSKPGQRSPAELEQEALFTNHASHRW